MVSLCCWTQCERPRCRCHKMSFLTIRALSARPRRRLVLGRDGELGPISPNEIDDLLEQMTARREASCHGRGREFESRRPRHSFQKRCTDFDETIEDPKGHVFVPFFGSLFARPIPVLGGPHAATRPDTDSGDVAFASHENTNDKTAA